MRGPIGGLTGLVGKGVAMGAEYREHRKDQKQARSASDQAAETGAQDSTRSSRGGQPEALPAYSGLPSSTERQVDHGAAATVHEKTELSSEEDIDTDDLYSDTDTDYYSIEDDEELLELDDALYAEDSKDLPTYEESEACYEPVDELVREVVSDSKPSITSAPSTSALDAKALSRPQLPYPVILPQRRPRKKARGFIRAYSPVLADCGISQEVFLTFLNNFHKSSQASPIFPVITISAAIAGMAPSVIAMAVCTAAQVAAGIGAEVQSRSRTNTFLDRINDELFKPAGLYAMIVKYQSDAEAQQSTSGLAGLASQVRAERADVSAYQKATIAKYNRTASDAKTVGDRMENLRLASGTTKGAAMLPESAPLIFPDIDKKVAQAGPETFNDKTKDAKKFLADYLDRRAQMEYATKHPHSSLSVPEQQRGFKSTVADSNHPMHSGGLVALVSGGKVAPRVEKGERRMERKLARDERRMARGREPKARKRYGEAYQNELAHRKEAKDGSTADSAGKDSVEGHRDGDVGEGSSRNALQYRAARRGRRNQKGALGAVKRVMRENVLYLTIVNMPNEAELANARLELEAPQQH
ncbi:hypothetical protein Slin15195_G020840 [Septoria linicola]|uniref:Uncharacterized protein n=1 Tax=Septoria linicola TaxID=215465 RepID=A0A9Q9EFB1_9PEZI|nr:hypothetical protein Slin15195_G020840 [Septoria linicola]